MKTIFLLCSILFFLANTSKAANLSPLAPMPHWSELDIYQETITRSQFVALLDSLYAPHDAWTKTIRIGDTEAEIDTGTKQGVYRLRFAKDQESTKPMKQSWKGKQNLSVRTADKPLEGLHIALDAGHIGGKWARMEERWFRIGRSKPVTEGDMTLAVAKILKPKLEALGAKVTLVRSKASPLTKLQPKQLVATAVKELKNRHEPATQQAIKKESERLFYRTAEIHERARVVNSRIKPDLVVCLHFNAEAWGDENKPTLTDVNHLHLLVSGGYLADELEFDDHRFAMLKKLLSRVASEEIPLGATIAKSMEKQTHLPPYTYRGSNAINVNGNPYLWGRNLLANRLFDCPVVYLEPYVMNSRETFTRIQEGDYAGKRRVAGASRESIFQEYANSVVQGMIDYFSKP